MGRKNWCIQIMLCITDTQPGVVHTTVTVKVTVLATHRFPSYILVFCANPSEFSCEDLRGDTTHDLLNQIHATVRPNSDGLQRSNVATLEIFFSLSCSMLGIVVRSRISWLRGTLESQASLTQGNPQPNDLSTLVSRAPLPRFFDNRDPKGHCVGPVKFEGPGPFQCRFIRSSFFSDWHRDTSKSCNVKLAVLPPMEVSLS